MRLTIRRDATISVHDEGGEEPSALDRDDQTAILTWLRSPVTLEEGVTPASLFRALRPWSAVLSRLAWMDFDAWDEVVSRAHLREVGNAPEPNLTDPNGTEAPALDAVEIGPEILVTNPRRDAILSVAWRTYGLSGLEDEERAWSLSLAPLSSWIRLPLRINPYSVVDERFLSDAGLATPGRTGSLSYVRAMFVAPTFWDAIVKGFLDGISATGSPDEARANRERIANAMAEMREIETMRPAYIPGDGA